MIEDSRIYNAVLAENTRALEVEEMVETLRETASKRLRAASLQVSAASACLIGEAILYLGPNTSWGDVPLSHFLDNTAARGGLIGVLFFAGCALLERGIVNLNEVSNTQNRANVIEATLMAAYIDGTL